MLVVFWTIPDAISAGLFFRSSETWVSSPRSVVLRKLPFKLMLVSGNEVPSKPLVISDAPCSTPFAICLVLHLRCRSAEITFVFAAFCQSISANLFPCSKGFKSTTTESFNPHVFEACGLWLTDVKSKAPVFAGAIPDCHSPCCKFLCSISGSTPASCP